MRAALLALAGRRADAVLVSDGGETAGDLRARLPALARRGIPVHARALPAVEAGDLRVDSLRLPRRASLGQTVAARALDGNRVLGEAWVQGLLPAFVSVDVQAIPSQASGVVAIWARAEPSKSVDIRLDGTLLRNCPGTACSYSWDTTTAANGPHIISIKGHNEPYASEMVAYVKITVANGTTGIRPRTSSTDTK